MKDKRLLALGRELVTMKTDLEILQADYDLARKEAEGLLKEGGEFLFSLDGGGVYTLSRKKQKNTVLKSNSAIRKVLSATDFMSVIKITITALKELGEIKFGQCVKKVELTYPLKLTRVKE